MLIVAAIAGLAGCGRVDPATKPTPGKAIEPLPGDLLPNEMLGLKVAAEDVSSTVAKSRRAYVDKLSIYSLRTGDKLMATLQVAHSNDPGKGRIKRFRDSVIGQIGSTQPRAMHLDGQTVYVTTGTKQRIAFWFRGRYLYVLATRDEYTERRTLLREMLAVKA